jgi:dipeptidyl-peptidase-4
VREITPASFHLRTFVSADLGRRQVWVLGGDDPTQTRLFRVPLDRAGKIEDAGGEPGRRTVAFARDHGIRVESWSGLDPLPRHAVIDAEGRVRGTLRAVTETPSIVPRPEFVTVGARKYRAVVLRPSWFRPGERYPVIVSVYGGPHGQRVMRTSKDYHLQQWIAEQGYVVVSIDGRGTPGRGRAWERAIHGNLIEVPLADQVEGLKALAAQYPEMDLARTGIYGWSFGGYFSAHAAMQRPDVFRAGVAGAPVADWRDYDTFYTERYMGLPSANPRGYDAASVLTHAAKLERPLLIVHGTVDDNVYFLHSMKMSQALFRAGKRFDFLPLAGFTHMVPDPLVTQRLYGRIADFFDEHVRGAEAHGDADARLAD